MTENIAAHEQPAAESPIPHAGLSSAPHAGGPTPVASDTDWAPDILGAGYYQQTFDLPEDEEGAVVVTVVKYAPDADPRPVTRPEKPRFAMVAVHGWNDYFYQTELARHVAEMGGAFFAVDLRKYGRSLRSWQTHGFTTDLSVYDGDIHLGIRTARTETGDGVPIVLYGHSTGGLITALWANRYPKQIDALVLNSPWLEFQASTALRQLGTPLLELAARLNPKAALPLPDNGYYQRVLEAWRPEGIHTITGTPADTDDPFWTTGWRPDPQLRTYPSPPTRVGWLSAILEGHARVAQGLAIPCPVLVLTSARSNMQSTWTEDFRSSDNVLDVQQIWKRIPDLGRHVTLIKLDGAIHDVLFSRREVREEGFAHIAQFLNAYV